MRPNQPQEGSTGLVASEGQAAILTGGLHVHCTAPGGQRGSLRLYLQDSDSDQPQRECGPGASPTHTLSCPDSPPATVLPETHGQKQTNHHVSKESKDKDLLSGLAFCDMRCARPALGSRI